MTGVQGPCHTVWDGSSLTYEQTSSEETVMTERENHQAQAEAVRRTAKAPSTPSRTRVDDAMRRYLTAEARRTRGTGTTNPKTS